MKNIVSLLQGEKRETYIIAEVGVNHNGSMDLAKKSIDLAVEIGADAVKFQTFKTEKLVSKFAPKADYQTANTQSKESQMEMLKRLELSFNDFRELKVYCEDKGIDFLSTPFDEESAHFLNEIGVSAFKIGSGDLNNTPFISFLDTFKKPILLSTGMSELKEVEETLAVMRQSPVILLHCTSNYPAPLEDVNLNAMTTMKSKFNKLVGYSDHTSGVEVSVAAVAMGAKIIEKHFTLDKNLPGPDHKASLNPEEFSELIFSVRSIERALGDGVKRCMPSEKNTKIVARKSIVANANLNKGQKITEDMIIIKRPGTGIEPKYYNKIMGRKLAKDIKMDETITWDDLI
ncbi:N-acetylneuraminate synthase [Bacillus toyonensis]|uniref:N-acetylneuraminate synthase n=1 Tax=Bacillus toyonensis TaxID=155322 RepID=UPI0026ED6B9C|nr:N-acetylneuraminate synthase [Bacillus toyonensis]